MAAPRGLIRVGVALDDGLVGEVHDPLDGGAVALGDLVDLEGGEDEIVAGVLALLLRRWGRGGGHTRTLARESLERFSMVMPQRLAFSLTSLTKASRSRRVNTRYRLRA